MTDIIPFNFHQNRVRTVKREDEPYFVGKDVAEALGYSKPRNAIAAHCKGALKQGLLTEGGIQEVVIIPERDVYRLIMRSKLPEAEAFEEWVVGHVLPSIRKTGSYTTKPQDLSRMDILKIAMDSEQERLRLEGEVAELKPKVDAYDRIATSDGSLCITSAAKDLQTRPKDLFAWLQSHRWIYRRPGGRWTAYQHRIQSGHLEHKVNAVERPDGSEKIVEQVLVTPKGLVKLAAAFEVAEAG
ncbi:phage antirepressor [Microbulbifer sp. 2205BS26-8]|uniref:phage antirepressor n=1 Tax=Microbulbifer sp. 2205BS26-8 TaxID=3064386 RepID=UPI00273F8019|nr:phage antirepressor [Microbulbifer sp. 2205BS26-8]MDP5210965.1 phage antirepressor [Microbulbifer sp. 2205BS26-8]